MYVNYYKRSWNKFLKENIVSEKKINSPFKKGEEYDFKLLEKGTSKYKPYKGKISWARL